jgi:hypothetical protein
LELREERKKNHELMGIVEKLNKKIEVKDIEVRKKKNDDRDLEIEE